MSTTDNAPSDPSGPPTRAPQLAEVWGDVVDVVHLRWSVIIGIGVGLPAYLLSLLLFRTVAASPELARTYALLAGLVGCLIAGAICARLFPPQRDLVEELTDPLAREEAIAELVGETGDLGSIDDLPEATRQELRDLGIYDLFAEPRRPVTTRQDDHGEPTSSTTPVEKAAP